MDKEVFQNNYDDYPESIDSEEELAEYLTNISSEIGWIIIYFNSLEDMVAQNIREMILRDPYQDERLDVFLAEMGYANKVKGLLHLYGQAIHSCDDTSLLTSLSALEMRLNECAGKRNSYAHADWIGLRENQFVKVKEKSSKRGIMHRYKAVTKQVICNDIEYIRVTRDSLENFHETLQDQIYRR